MAEAEFTLALTGISGCGKSSVGNFFLQKKLFPTGFGPNPITDKTYFNEATIGGKCVKIVDMPGFLDVYSLTSKADYKELARAILDTPNGITALGFVIDPTARFLYGYTEYLERFLFLKELVPYTFVIFTHAKTFGKTDEEQQKWIKTSINETFPKALQQVLESIDNRYLLLESTLSMEDPNYEERKLQELSEMLQKLAIQNKVPFSPKYTDVAKMFEKLTKEQKETLVDPMATDLEEIKYTGGKNQQIDIDNSLYWKTFTKCLDYFKFGLGYLTSAVKSGTSALINFIYSNPELCSQILEAAQQKQINSK